MRGKAICSLICGVVLAASPCAAADSGGVSAAENTGTEGGTLQILTPDTTVRDLVGAYLPGYTATDDTHGTVTDADGQTVTVVWTILDDADGSYQNQVDGQLFSNEGYLPDDRIDLFTASTGYLRKYTGSGADVAVPLKELGFTDDELAFQYNYTKNAASDEDGQIRGAAVEANVGLMLYNRAIAKSVLGTDDPDAVASKVTDLDALKQTAGALSNGGSRLVQTAGELYPLYAARRGAPWVTDGTVRVDASLKQWADDCRAYADAGQLTTDAYGSDEWKKGLQPDSGCFAYFEPLHVIQSTVADSGDQSVAAGGGWAVCAGPSAFTSGDLYLLAARGTDNPTLDAQIIRRLTVDEDSMSAMEGTALDVNSKPVIRALAADGNAGLSVLGGQNPYGVLDGNGKKIDVSKGSSYDSELDDLFQSAMKDYIDVRITYEEALRNFRKNVGRCFMNLEAK